MTKTRTFSITIELEDGQEMTDEQAESYLAKFEDFLANKGYSLYDSWQLEED